MELGVDPISEKPLCTHAEQAQSIVDTQRRTGRKLDATFNARHEASAMIVKELLLAGEIGDLYSVSYEEFPDLAATSGAGTGSSRPVARCSATRPATISTS